MTECHLICCDKNPQSADLQEDPYFRDVLEQGQRVADCQETHGDFDYIEFWVEVARLNALLKL